MSREAMQAELEDTLRKEKQAFVINVVQNTDSSEEPVPGSINIAIKDTAEFIRQVEKNTENHEQKVVVYASEKNRKLASQAQQILADAGFNNVWEFEPGQVSDIHASLDVVSTQEEE